MLKWIRARAIWSDPVWSKVIASGILALLCVVAAAVTRFHEQSHAAFLAVRSALVGDVRVPAYAVALGGAAVLAAAVQVVMVATRRLLPFVVREAKWRQFREGDYHGMRWRWKVSDDGWVFDPKPYCPHCDCELRTRDRSPYQAAPELLMGCDGCGFCAVLSTESEDDFVQTVKRLISRDLRARGAPSP